MAKPDFEPIKIEEIEDLIDTAIQKRAENSRVLTPEVCQAHSVMAAEIMLNILGSNYGRHNLTNDLQKTADEIACGRIQPFICGNNEDGPTSCAALIKQGETDVEIGRGACLPGKNGGGALPLLLAFKAWSRNQIFPESRVLRVEVRTAKPTKEVPGGQATQAICLNTLNFPPTAIGPLFHHGSPDRQEMFLLGSQWKDPTLIRDFSTELKLPRLLLEDPNQLEVFSFFWKKFFGKKAQLLFDEVGDKTTWSTFLTFTSRQEGPILVIEPEEVASVSTPSVDRQVINAFNQGLCFAMARVPLTENSTLTNLQVFHLNSSGFRTMGFEPVLNQGRIKINLLLGRLSPEGQSRLVSPCFIENVFPHEIEDALLSDFVHWRRINRGGSGY